jgi:hypothetical protein
MLFAFGGPTKSRNQRTDAANAIPLRLENGYSVASARTERLSPDANRFPVLHQQRGAARPDPTRGAKAGGNVSSTYLPLP